MSNILELFALPSEMSETIVVEGMTFHHPKGNYFLSPKKITKAVNKLNVIEKRLLKEFNEKHPIVITIFTRTSALFLFTTDDCGLNISIDVFGKIHLGAIMHEMVHYDQWCRKDLSHEMGMIIWKEKEYMPITRLGEAYMHQPWEEEAYIKTFQWMIDTKRTKLSITEQFDRQILSIERGEKVAKCILSVGETIGRGIGKTIKSVRKVVSLVK